jgi:hypothetical protein
VAKARGLRLLRPALTRQRKSNPPRTGAMRTVRIPGGGRKEGSGRRLRRTHAATSRKARNNAAASHHQSWRTEDTVMDATRFDAITRALSAREHRRRALNWLLGGALALHGAIGFPGAETEAKKGKRKDTKRWCHCPSSDLSKCVTIEIKKNARQRHRKKHKFDSPGRCKPFTCPAGQTNCDGECKNLQNDETNCGACGASCGAVQGCCGGVCKNLNTDEANCGTCGNVCGAGLTCCSGVCVSTDVSPVNCGSCGNICPAPTVLCLGGNCCKPPTSACPVVGADPACCSGVCLPAGGVGFTHCA